MWIAEPLTASSKTLGRWERVPSPKAGNTLTKAPLSTRKQRPEMSSFTYSSRALSSLHIVTVAILGAAGWLQLFAYYHQNAYDRNATFVAVYHV